MRFTVVFAISIIACTLGTPSAQEPVRDGVWGGKGIQMTVTAEGAAIDYGCDSGTIEGRIQTDSKGKFHARGTHVGIRYSGVSVAAVCIHERRPAGATL